MTADRLPVAVITGFLGSGKTTLLQRLLDSPSLGDIAVLINEFGAVAIDHALVSYVEENIVVLASGCLCCTVRDDLGKALRDLLARRASGEVRFSRIALETSGLADPVPILHTLMTDPVLDTALRIGTVVTTVDAINGESHLDREIEALRQVAIADVILVTKTDIAPTEAVDRLMTRLRKINPGAAMHVAADDGFVPEAVLPDGAWDHERMAREAVRWLDHLPPSRDGRRHDEAISAYSFALDTPLDWAGFAVWLTMFIHRHGADILRIKALLNVDGEPGPVAVHGVQHVVHPPVHLARWPDGDTRSRLVFITRGIPGDTIAASLAAFSRAALAMRRGGQVAPPVAPTATEIGGRPVRRTGGLAWTKQAVLAAPRVLKN